MSKYFLLSPEKKESSKKIIKSIEAAQQDVLRSESELLSIKSKEQLDEEDSLIHVEGRVVVKVDMQAKNFHTFEGGVTIRRERAFNEFNRRITEPVNCLVISGEAIPKNAEILVDHNALHETNRINDYKNSFENAESDRIRYYSIPVYECYVWRIRGEKWNPIHPFEFGLRVFKPYEGNLIGVEPEQLKDTLYVTSGELQGNVVRTVKGADYQIIFQGDNGREDYLIRFRPFGDEKMKLEEEAIAILHDETRKVEDGALLIGYTIKDATQLEITAYVD